MRWRRYSLLLEPLRLYQLCGTATSATEKTASGPHSRESPGTSYRQLLLVPETLWPEDRNTLLTSVLLAEDLAIS